MLRSSRLDSASPHEHSQSASRSRSEVRYQKEDGDRREILNMMSPEPSNYANRIASLAEHSQNLIQQEWINAGKPHNFICSECRNPGQMIGCATCCRSYHLSCLTAAPPAADELSTWSCAACRERLDAIVMNQAAAAAASTDISAASPDACPSPIPIGGGSTTPTPTTSGSTPGSPAGKSPRQTQYQPSISAHSITPIPILTQIPTSTPPQTQNDDPDFSLERTLLIEHGKFPPDQEFTRDLLLQIRRLRLHADFLQTHTRHELDSLRSENARLRKENAQLKKSAKAAARRPSHLYAMRRSSSASRATTLASSLTGSTGSGMVDPILGRVKASDGVEKSWDRIISDAF